MENGLVNPIISIFEWNSDFDKNYKYKYIGKEKNDGKKYIKFSIEYEKDIYKEIYYLDIENGTISKTECYGKNDNGLVLTSTINYTYSYNTVTDEDVAKFNVNNYSEYQYIEE